MLRKINAYISLLTTALFLGHAGFYSVWMLKRCAIEKPGVAASWVLVVLMLVHAVLSIVMAIRAHKNLPKCEVNSYPAQNVATNVQRYTGLALIVLLGLHIAGAVNHFQPKMLHAVLHPLFFALAVAHTAVSTSKALITLGIGNARAVKIVDVVAKIICGVILAACVTGFYMCLFMGVAR